MPDFCEHCIDLKEIPGTPAGKDSEVAGVPSYVAEGSGAKGSIVLATDIFGLGVPNPKLIADALAKQTGFKVVVPDLFKGDPIKPTDFVLPKHASEGAPDQSRQDKNNEVLGGWVGRGHSPPETYPLFQSVVKSLAADGPVGGVGFCYGSRIVANAAISGEIKAGALYHPAMLEADEASKVQVKVLLNQAEFDPMFADDVRKSWNDTLKSAGLLDSRSQQYDGTVHGFGTRPDLSKPDLKKAYEAALSNTAAFFKDTLAA